jgi:hypothetical protein
MDLLSTIKFRSIGDNVMECKCNHCGMGVKGLICSQCNTPLVKDTITTDKQTQVQVAKCPKGCGMIKSPVCCGHDMSCSV